MKRGKNCSRGRYQARGGAGSGRGARLKNFTGSNKDTQPHRDDHKKHKGVACFRCKQEGHVVKNCPFNSKQNTSRRGGSNMAELEGVALISSTMNRSDEWFIDSAATKHTTNERIKYFGELCSIPATKEHLSGRQHRNS